MVSARSQERHRSLRRSAEARLNLDGYMWRISRELLRPGKTPDPRTIVERTTQLTRTHGTHAGIPTSESSDTVDTSACISLS